MRIELENLRALFLIPNPKMLKPVVEGAYHDRRFRLRLTTSLKIWPRIGSNIMAAATRATMVTTTRSSRDAIGKCDVAPPFCSQT